MPNLKKTCRCCKTRSRAVTYMAFGDEEIPLCSRCRMDCSMDTVSFKPIHTPSILSHSTYKAIEKQPTPLFHPGELPCPDFAPAPQPDKDGPLAGIRYVLWLRVKRKFVYDYTGGGTSTGRY